MFSMHKGVRPISCGNTGDKAVESGTFDEFSNGFNEWSGLSKGPVSSHTESRGRHEIYWHRARHAGCHVLGHQRWHHGYTDGQRVGSPYHIILPRGRRVPILFRMVHHPFQTELGLFITLPSLVAAGRHRCGRKFHFLLSEHTGIEGGCCSDFDVYGADIRSSDFLPVQDRAVDLVQMGLCILCNCRHRPDYRRL